MTPEEAQIVFSALIGEECNTFWHTTLLGAAKDILKSYMGDDTITEVEYNSGVIMMRGPPEMFKERETDE